MISYKKKFLTFLSRSPIIYKLLYICYFEFIRLIKFPIYFLTTNYLVIKGYLTKKRLVINYLESQFFGDGMATIRHVSFLEDKKFMLSYNKSFEGIKSFPHQKKTFENILWRAHIVLWASKRAIKLGGDFVECGVWYGILSKFICEYLNFKQYKNKKFYLIDTWGDQTLNLKHQVKYPDDIYLMVKKRFRKFSNVKLIRGFVPNILEDIPLKKIAYLSIDMNGDKAERATLEKYYSKMVRGGIIYFDDYGWNYPKLRKTVDEFFANKPETLLHFPSGNSIVIKL
jgi:O-methyltransferase